MAHAGELSFSDAPGAGLAIISPNDPGAMLKYTEECRTLGVPFIFDPGQQCARMSGDDLRQGLRGASIVMLNDYELELLRQKTGWSEVELLRGAGALVITRGERGSTVLTGTERVEAPAVPPDRVVDPTGVGDAFRGGFMKGLASGAPHEVCARLGSVAAAYSLEHLGGQSHAFAWPEFCARYERHFGPLALGA
jgi:adenosine kinase